VEISGHSAELSHVASTAELLTKTGRNDPCPCGSGRKYKQCCQQRESAAALHGRGTAAVTAGRLEEGADLIRRAIDLHPASPLYHCDLGVALHRLGRLEEAAAAYRQAVSLAPDFTGALANLGGVLLNLRRLDEALPCLEKAVAANPSHVLAHTNLGLVLHALGRSREGMHYVRKAVELAAPRSLVPVRSCAALLVELERWREALPYCEQWVALEPEHAEAHQALGNCHKFAGDPHEAARHYWKALQLNPNLHAAANNLGLCLAEDGQHETAIPLYRKAIELSPDWAIAWTNLGEALRALGQGEAALACHDRAIALEPENPRMRWNRSLCLLAMGRLEEGWAEYGWRCANPDSWLRPFTQPRWDGSDPAGKRFLVWMEQGLGDEILFSGMIPDLVRAGAHCVVECDWRLVSLLERSFPGVEAVARTRPAHPRTRERDIDFQVAAGSLARRFRPTLESFPRHNGYFVPDPVRVAEWNERLAALGEGIKVGVCWRSMLNQGARSRHYSQLNQWGPILTTPGVRFVNLQYDRCEEELAEAERLFDMRIHRWEDIDLKDDQEAVAAIASVLDVVIAPSTAVSEMAGAVGRPTWVPVRGLTNWWGLGTDYCPWLPSVRAFICQATDPWEPLIGKIAAALRTLTKAASGSD
jgi:tetratricopeptide (TPR) repeat protein